MMLGGWVIYVCIDGEFVIVCGVVFMVWGILIMCIDFIVVVVW